VAQACRADLVLSVDADELWPVGAARATLEYVYAQNRAGRWLAHFQHFWRSFNREVHDHFRPVRIQDLRHPVTVDAYLDLGPQPEPVLHFGYAQAPATIAYKWTCHGHKPELRPGWFQEKFMGWSPTNDVGDLHPVVIGLWDKAREPSPHTKELLSALLHDHPYFGKEIIG
jgi:hypothetical protein